MPSVMRRVLNSVWPSGATWLPAPDKGLDWLLEALGESLDEARDDMQTLATLRMPADTALLPELEIDYGIVPDTGMTESERRRVLELKKNRRFSGATPEDLQDTLRDAGFDVFVYSNDPAVNPAPFTSAFLLTAGADNAHAGEPDAVAEVDQRKILVNGDLVISTSEYLAHAGELEGIAGEDEAVAEITGTAETLFEYTSPSNPGDWPLVFFVGGAATFAPDGSIININVASIPAARIPEFKRTILEIKSTHSWAILIIQET